MAELVRCLVHVGCGLGYLWVGVVAWASRRILRSDLLGSLSFAVAPDYLGCGDALVVGAFVVDYLAACSLRLHGVFLRVI